MDIRALEQDDLLSDVEGGREMESDRVLVKPPVLPDLSSMNLQGDWISTKDFEIHSPIRPQCSTEASLLQFLHGS